MKHKTDAGFSSIEVLLTLIVIVIVGSVGLFVYSSQSKHNSAPKTKSNGSLAVRIKTSGWQTFADDGTKYPTTPDGNGDAVGFSFMYPGNWKFFPIGTMTNGAAAAYNSISPSSANSPVSNNLAFSSIKTNLSAKDYFRVSKSNSNQRAINSPVWEGIDDFTTKNGYTAYIVKLQETKSSIAYETIISNKSGAVIFDYGSESSKYFSIYRDIFNTVKII